MKYSESEYKAELQKARLVTSNGSKIDEMMRPFLVKLHQGIEIGDGVTINLYSDSHACTVIGRTPKTVTCRRDLAIRTDNLGFSDCQRYKYEPDEHGTVYTARWSEKRGCFIFGGSKDGKLISIGRHEYYDFSF